MLCTCATLFRSANKILLIQYQIDVMWHHSWCIPLYHCIIELTRSLAENCAIERFT